MTIGAAEASPEPQFRRATRADLPGVIALLADDPLGAVREQLSDPIAPSYAAAFDAIDRDPNQLLAVAEAEDGLVGCLQITFLPGLAHQGAWRGQIEGVRIARRRRSQGLGARFMLWAIERCRERRCGLVQLTSDKTRDGAHRFYDQLGFAASHEGYKLRL